MASELMPRGTAAPEVASVAKAAMPSPYLLAALDGGGHMRRLEEFEAEVIKLAISRYDGHMSEVARRLGIGRSTLYRKLKDLGLESSDPEMASQGLEPPRQAAS
jgi:DNA-binding NtrC family response regulator